MSDKDSPLSAAQLDARVAGLEPEIQPAAALWDAIGQQLDDVSSASATRAPAVVVPLAPRRAWPEWAVAAAFVAATVAFITFDFLDEDVPQTTLAAEQNQSATRLASFETHAGYGSELIRVRQQLRTELRMALEELSPATRQVVVENLTRIEEARAEIETALAQEPGNRLLEQLLLTSYTNELTLLHEFTGVARAAQQRIQL